MPTKTLAIPYHRQLDVNYCGPACMQMVVQGAGGTSPGQDALYTDAHNHGGLDPSTNWASPPDGIDWTLDAVLGANTFNLVDLSSEATLTRRIVWSIFKHSAPCVALVYGIAHWLTVVGYDVSDNPSSKTDTSYDLNALDLLDPWRTADEGLPPPPPPPRHVTYKEWRRTYLQPVPHGYWTGRVLAIGNFAATTSARSLGVGPRDVGTPGDETSLVSPERARGHAIAGLERYGLTTREDWQRVLVPGFAAAEPMLVQRLDNPDFYYLVPVGPPAPERSVQAVVRVDALSGDYLEANAVATLDTATHKSWGAFAAEATEAATRSRIAGQRLRLPGLGGRVLARSEGLGVHPAFVWRPCRESLSPILPFRLITIGDRVYYQRLDGVLFDSLHDPTPGN